MNLALLTDLYELTMMQGYYFYRADEEAVFDLFFRRQPFQSGYTIFAGLEPLIKAVVNLRFTDDDIEYLKSLKIFKTEFLDYLKNFRFTGDIYALKEGSIVFPNEPLIRFHGKLIELQLLESLSLNIINFQSLIATKTARIVNATKGGAVLEFGLRRAQGINGALSATRASFIGGAVATSNVLAGKLYNIPPKGTMAHSWVMSFDSEIESFEKYAQLYPDSCVLLVDTYDTLAKGVPAAIKVLKKLKQKGKTNLGIRLDSGDLEYLSKKAREMLDKEGLEDVKIVVSNELDEYIIEQLVTKGAPIDVWGVGTKLITAPPDASLSGVYKIVAKKKNKNFEPCIKLSNNPEKITNPGIKNILRFYDKNGKMIADLLYLEEEKESLLSKIRKKEPIKFNHPNIDYAHIIVKEYSKVEELLFPVVKDGKIVYNFPDLKEIQIFVKNQLESLDETYKRLLNPHIYKVSLSNRLRELKTRLINKFKK